MVLGSDNGRVVRLVLEMGKGDEEEVEKTERDLTRGWDLWEQDFSSLIMWARLL